MKLSIITINYNNAAGLKKTLDSVAAQTYPNIEHIIVDGASTDGSVDVIKEYEKQLNITHSTINLLWSSEPDTGIYNAMNKGIEIALGRRVVNALNRSERSECENKADEIALGKRIVNSFNRSELVEEVREAQCMNELKNEGVRELVSEESSTLHIQQSTERSVSSYIQILNSGDILAAPDVTERMMSALYTVHRTPYTDAAGSPSIIYGNMIKEHPDGRRHRDTCGGALYTPESFLYFYKGTLNHDCAYIRKDLFEKYGLYNEQMKICSDWEWYVRAIALGGEKAHYTDIDVTVFDMTGISESDGKNRELIQRERREYLEQILPASVLHDYDTFGFPILQYQRLKKYHLWGLVYFMERVLFKLEKWRILR